MRYTSRRLKMTFSIEIVKEIRNLETKEILGIILARELLDIANFEDKIPKRWVEL